MRAWINISIYLLAAICLITLAACSPATEDAFYEIPESEVSKTDEPAKTKTSTPTPTVAASPTVTPTPAQEDDPAYKTYIDEVYEFSCPYPAEFKEQTVEQFEIKKQYDATDNTAIMRIGAKYNTAEQTTTEVMQEYLDEMYGTISYQDNGETWFAAKIDDGYWTYYRKCFVRDGKIYWFDLNYNNDSATFYDGYINYIEKRFKAL